MNQIDFFLFIHNRLHFEKDEFRWFNLCHLEKLQNLTHYHLKIRIESCKKWVFGNWKVTDKMVMSNFELLLFHHFFHSLSKLTRKVHDALTFIIECIITHCIAMRALLAAPPPSWHGHQPQLPPRTEWNPSTVKIQIIL